MALGNFKMNGTLQSIKDIVIALNDAKLNQDVGKQALNLTFDFC